MSTVHELMVVNDVVIFFPRTIREHVEKYVRKYSIDWLTVLDKSRDYDTLKIQLSEKEKEINRLAAVADDRERALNEKEREIATLSEARRQLEAVLVERDKLLKEISHQAELRLSEMEKMTHIIEEQRDEIQLLHAARNEMQESPD